MYDDYMKSNKEDYVTAAQWTNIMNVAVILVTVDRNPPSVAAAQSGGGSSSSSDPAAAKTNLPGVGGPANVLGGVQARSMYVVTTTFKNTNIIITGGSTFVTKPTFTYDMFGQKKVEPISSWGGYARVDEVQKFIAPLNDMYMTGVFISDRDHRGIDLRARKDPVYSIADGKVLLVGATGKRGTFVYIDHGNGTQSVYEHLESASVKQDAKILQGEQVGISGRSGDAAYNYPYHLHFELLMGVPDSETKKALIKGTPPYNWPIGPDGKQTPLYHVDPLDYLLK